MAENQIEGEVLGISWDGTGYGTDGTVWGGEFLITKGAGFERFAAFKAFRLPGGEKAIMEPRRTAAGLLYEVLGEDVFRQRDLAPMSEFSVAELSIILQMLKNGVQAPLTSSAGRLFDGIASIMGLRHHNSFEGQAAMELEFALTGEASEQTYRCAVRRSLDEEPGERNAGQGRATRPLYVVDWSQMIKDVWADSRRCVAASLISKKFHNALVEAILDVVREAGLKRIVLTGGCFQNRYLTERAVNRLRALGFQPYWHQRVPPNDGGVSLGQIYAARIMNAERDRVGNEIVKEGAQ